VEIGIEIQIFLHREIFVQAELLRHVADAILHLLRIGADVDVQNCHLAAIGSHQTCNQANQRGLARAIRSDQRRETAVRHHQRDSVERRYHFTAFAQKSLANVAPA